MSNECFLSDDLVISTFLRMAGAKFMKLCSIPHSSKTISGVDRLNPLHQQDRTKTYDVWQ